MSSAQLCVQVHSKVNSSCAFLPSGSLCQLRLCWGTQLLHLCGHTNTACSLSILSHIKNPITLRFWLHWSRWRSRQILTSRPKIYCSRASRTIWIILQGSSIWLCWEVCRNTVLDPAFISLSVTLGTLLVMLFMMLRTRQRGSPMHGMTVLRPVQNQVNSVQELGFTELAKYCAT